MLKSSVSWDGGAGLGLGLHVCLNHDCIVKNVQKDLGMVSSCTFFTLKRYITNFTIMPAGLEPGVCRQQSAIQHRPNITNMKVHKYFYIIQYFFQVVRLKDDTGGREAGNIRWAFSVINPSPSPKAECMHCNKTFLSGVASKMDIKVTLRKERFTTIFAMKSFLLVRKVWTRMCCFR